MGDRLSQPDRWFAGGVADVTLATAWTRRAPPATSRTPILPTELIADIIDRAVELLVEEERYLTFQTPVTNHFLLSAMLVNRTWHNLAVKALLKNALVRPGTVARFISRLEVHGMKERLGRVRFGAGAAGLDDPAHGPFDGGEDDLDFHLLLLSLPSLRELELVGNGLRFRARLTGIRAYAIKTLTLSNWRYSDNLIVFRKFAGTPPACLRIIETKPALHRRYSDPDILETIRFFRLIYTIEVLTNEPYWYLDSFARLESPEPGSPVAPFNLVKGIHFESVRPFDWEWIVSNAHDQADIITYPHLAHLATHLEPLHFLALKGDRPALKSLEILPDPAGRVAPGYRPILQADAVRMLLELVEKVEELATLKAPAGWRTEAVEKLCEKKGLLLEWT